MCCCFRPALPALACFSTNLTGATSSSPMCNNLRNARSRQVKIAVKVFPQTSYVELRNCADPLYLRKLPAGGKHAASKGREACSTFACRNMRGHFVPGFGMWGSPAQLTNSVQPAKTRTPLAQTTSTANPGVSIDIPRQNTTPEISPTSGVAHRTPVPSGSGGVPAAFPRYFSFGVMNPPGAASDLDQMRSQNGAAFAFRYQYLTGGVNTGKGWETWNQPAGQFATYYMQESAQHGYMPVFVYYEICLSNGPQPSSYCGGHNLQQDTGNLADASTMNAYFANWVLMLQKIAAFGKPVLVIVEPDLWGFLQNASNGSNNAANVPASVSSSGYADAAGFPNTAQGFAWALLHMRDKYARNALLTIHASTWAAGADIATDTRPSLDVAGIAQAEANFLNSAGLSGNPAGVSSWDLVSNDVAD